MYTTVIWVPRHEGHIRNERADELAKQGAALNQDTNKVDCDTYNSSS